MPSGPRKEARAGRGAARSPSSAPDVPAQAATPENEIGNKVYRRSPELMDVGCGMTYNLIVSGRLREEVWGFADVGAAPLCERQDFLGRFELWANHQDKVDYFKDHVYE